MLLQIMSWKGCMQLQNWDKPKTQPATSDYEDI